MEPSPPTLQLRAARTADAPRVAKCYLASRKGNLAFVPMRQTEQEVLAWVRDVLMKNHAVTVANDSGQVVGFIAVAQRDGGDWIQELHVHPSFVRRGIGSTLLQVSLMRLKGPVLHFTFEANRGGRRFLERYGFEAIAHGDGSSNAEGLADVLYQRAQPPAAS